MCFKCHEFIPIVENSFLNKNEVEIFDNLHSGHPVQIVIKEELGNKFVWKKNLNPEVHSIETKKQRL
ncbi:MAG: hypothetical protein P8Y23_07535 [Candidatus Lokiarchaeota archaeon]